jgi:hypothetical protein
MDSQVVLAWQTLYGSDAVRQLRTDLATRNESLENAIAEWSTAISEANDDVTAEMNFQYAEYQDSEIISHYTASTSALASARKYSKLADADMQSLSTRLLGELAAVKLQRARLAAQYPDLGQQEQKP